METSDASALARIAGRMRAMPPWLQDLLLAILVCEADLVNVFWGEEATNDGVLGPVPTPVAVAIVLFVTAPLVFRRGNPILVMVLTGFGAGVAIALGVQLQALAPVVALYSVAAYGTLRDTVVSTVVFLAVSTGAVAATGQLSALYANTLIVLGVAVMGRLIQSHRAQEIALTERAAQLEASRETNSALAVRTERARIAREMHDVLAHSTSVMVVQAAGARRLVRSRPEATEEALGVIETTGRETLADIRRMLGLLRRDDVDPDAPIRPQPGVGDLPELVEEFRDGGLPVELRRAGDDLEGLDPAVSLSVYRIVQEALTNALKHAGADRVVIDVRHFPGRLEVEVLDDGGRERAPADRRGRDVDPTRRPDGDDGALAGAGAGYGLLGMRERALMAGGRLEAGPRPGGGFRVAAIFPLAGAASGRPVDRQHGATA